MTPNGPSAPTPSWGRFFACNSGMVVGGGSSPEFRDAVHLIPMAHTAVVFTPRRLLRASEEISPSNVMVDADFSAA
jgi:hypothetical protein